MPSAQPTSSPNIVRELFSIELVQEVVCSQCSTVSHKLQESYGVVLPLPSAPADAKEDRHTPSHKRSCKAAARAVPRHLPRGRAGGACGAAAGEADEPIDVFRCLAAFMQPETLDGANCYWCDRCASSCLGTMRTAFGRLPPVLVLAIGRTWWSERLGQQKDQRWVGFPTELDAACLRPSRHAEEKLAGPFYRLRAVISHSGRSADIGHYFTYILTTPTAAPPEQWYMLNDRRVTRVSEAEVLKCQAYMLFYESTQ
ncbi:hypothetical protein AB1Y20_003471 [Prymnesium parvum]